MPNRRYCGQGGGLDWQARKSLIAEITAALAGQLIQIEKLREDAAKPVPAKDSGPRRMIDCGT